MTATGFHPLGRPGNPGNRLALPARAIRTARPGGVGPVMGRGAGLIVAAGPGVGIDIALRKLDGLLGRHDLQQVLTAPGGFVLSRRW